MTALVEQLTAADGSWDVCELSELAPDADALRLPGLSKCQDIVAGSQSCPVLALPDTPEQLRYSLPPRKVRHWRMARNRAARRGEIKFETADPTTARFLLAQVIRLHQARWERQGESGVFADPQVTRFHYDAIGQLVDAGLARIYTVEVGGSTVGAYYGFVHRGRAFAYVFGFDPEWAFESPGTILIWHAIEQAIREGAREFHFLRGREAYKYRWGAKDRWNRVRTLRRAEVYADAS